jgi:serine/threonine protein kinase
MATNLASIEGIFSEALEILSLEARAAFLDRACAADPELRRQVESLLDAHDRAGRFLASPTDSFEFDSTEPVGSTVGPYKLLEQIGEGGMGIVYMAEQIKPVRRKVALKIIKPGMDTKHVIARFDAERQALAMMEHPGIARVLDAGATESRRPFFVMELVKGIRITDYCDRNRLPIEDRLELFVSVCQALQHAHQKGIIHRDLKPSNVLVTMIDGAAVPKIIDFGVAKAMGHQLTERTLYTGFAQLIGTPLYMSPEQAEFSGVDVDTRSDIYALGVLLYELLTGTTPFDADTFRTEAYDQIRRIIREQEPPKPSTRISTLEATAATESASRKCDPVSLHNLIRGELDWIVMKALEKDRNRRYETASGLAADVRRYLDDEPVQACPPSAWYRFGKFVRRNRLVLTAAGLTAVALIAGTAVSTWQAIRASKAERRVSDALTESKAQTVAAEALRRQAQDSAEQGRRRQVQLNVEQGTRLMNDGDLTGSLPYFVEALRLDNNDHERAESHRLRLGLLMGQCAKPARIWFNDHAIEMCRLGPDGRGFAVATSDGTITARDADTGQLIGPPLKHASFVSNFNFSPDGRRLITACEDRAARIWDVASGQEVVPRLEHATQVRTVAFSSGGRLLLTCAFSRRAGVPTCRVWDAGTGQPVSVWFECYPHGSAALSPDGRFVAVQQGDVLRIYDVRTSKPTTPPMVHGDAVLVGEASFSPDGTRVVTGCLDAKVRIWNTTTGKQTVPHMKHGGAGASASFSPDGRWVVSFSDDGIACV